VTTPRRLATILVALAVSVITATPAWAQSPDRPEVTWNDAPWGGRITIDQATYPDRASVPRIVVRLPTATPRRDVRLEWYDRAGKRWRLENQRRSKNGLVRLQMNPLCTNAAGVEGYCNSTFGYRIVVRKTARERGFISPPARVTFAPLAP